jgi:hypothetical protein
VFRCHPFLTLRSRIQSAADGSETSTTHQNPCRAGFSCDPKALSTKESQGELRFVSSACMPVRGLSFSHLVQVKARPGSHFTKELCTERNTHPFLILFYFSCNPPTGSTRSTAKLHYSTTGRQPMLPRLSLTQSLICLMPGSVARLPCLMPVRADAIAFRYDFAHTLARHGIRRSMIAISFLSCPLCHLDPIGLSIDFRRSESIPRKLN